VRLTGGKERQVGLLEQQEALLTASARNQIHISANANKYRQITVERSDSSR